MTAVINILATAGGVMLGCSLWMLGVSNDVAAGIFQDVVAQLLTEEDVVIGIDGQVSECGRQAQVGLQRLVAVGEPEVAIIDILLHIANLATVQLIEASIVGVGIVEDIDLVGIGGNISRLTRLLSAGIGNLSRLILI